MGAFAGGAGPGDDGRGGVGLFSPDRERRVRGGAATTLERRFS